MRHAESKSPPRESEPDENPGVSGFRSWRSVYVFVLLTFIMVVVALSLFSKTFA